jgi:hypothetical protein
MQNRRGTLVGMLGLSLLPNVLQAKGASSPEATVRALLSAMESNDAARIRSAFSPTATQAYGNRKSKTGRAFTQWLQSDIISVQGRVENPRLVVTGNEVVVTGRYRNTTGYSSAANFLFKVSNGQIISWQMRY